MTSKPADLAAFLRSALKTQLGLTGRDVAVKTNTYSGGSAIRVAIKTTKAIPLSTEIQRFAEIIVAREWSGGFIEKSVIQFSIQTDAAVEFAREAGVLAAAMGAAEVVNGDRGTVIGLGLLNEFRLSVEWNDRYSRVEIRGASDDEDTLDRIGLVGRINESAVSYALLYAAGFEA